MQHWLRMVKHPRLGSMFEDALSDLTVHRPTVTEVWKTPEGIRRYLTGDLGLTGCDLVEVREDGTVPVNGDD